MNNTASIPQQISRSPLWFQFILRFRNPLIILLITVSLLSAITGDISSFVVITIILFFSISMDFFQEMRAEHTIAALRQSVALKAQSIRNGKTMDLPVKEVVPGDIILLSPGILVPADGRLISEKDLYVNQSLLTGESFPVEKNVRDLPADADELTDAVNSVFMGTSVISGTASMLVIATGRNTQLGHLAGQLGHRHPLTEFEKGVEKFGLLLLHISIAMVLLVLLVNIIFHRPMLESFIFALALAVGMAPELLPMILTITLSRGARRMAKAKVIVKHLPAMHNLGAMDVLCTDKTGTLTEAEIHLVKTIDTGGNESDHVFLLAYLNSIFESGVKTPLDQAILDYRQLQIDAWQKIDEIPFDFERRRISVLVASGNRRLLIVKGAPEDILQCSTHIEHTDGALQDMDAAKKQQFIEQFEGLGEQGYRALGIAYREVDVSHSTATLTDELELIFAGFSIFVDPPKESAKTALAQLAHDGIQVKIISGDNERITKHLCKMLDFNAGDIITGHELEQMNAESLHARIQGAHVFCRVTPQQKSRVIAALRTSGHTVGFLGDGINDATALHEADVGISVNSAADVAKEAADIVLLEHDLSIIHGGVEEGRRAVVNTEKYILMGSSSTFGNMFSMALGTLFLPFLPLLPIQVLLNNLLYDLSETAVPFDNVDIEALKDPIWWDINRVKRFMWILGPISSLFDFLTFYALLALFHAGEAEFHTGWFMESLITQTLIVFAIRTRKPLFRSRPHPMLIWSAVIITIITIMLPFTPAGKWLGFVPLPFTFFIFLMVAVVIYFMLVEIVKLAFKRFFESAALSAPAIIPAASVARR